MNTIERMHEWLAWWRGEGLLDDDGPERPADITQYEDKQIREVAYKLAGVMRGRGE